MRKTKNQQLINLFETHLYFGFSSFRISLVCESDPPLRVESGVVLVIYVSACDNTIDGCVWLHVGTGAIRGEDGEYSLLPFVVQWVFLPVYDEEGMHLTVHAMAVLIPEILGQSRREARD